jgi:hypothetical protein
MKYFCTRLNFIYPIYLPALKENFLRRDFNFAYYLGLAYAKTLEEFFTVSWVTLVFALLGTAGMKFSEHHEWTTWMGLVFSLCFVLVYFVFFKVIKQVSFRLKPSIKNTEQFNFNIDNSGCQVNPFDLYDHIQSPKYLEQAKAFYQ